MDGLLRNMDYRGNKQRKKEHLYVGASKRQRALLCELHIGNVNVSEKRKRHTSYVSAAIQATSTVATRVRNPMSMLDIALLCLASMIAHIMAFRQQEECTPGTSTNYVTPDLKAWALRGSSEPELKCTPGTSVSLVSIDTHGLIRLINSEN